MKRHHWIVRVTHWVNAVALTIMVGSGLRIFNAYPAFARRGETFCCYPFAHKAIPSWLTFGGWLAGARNWHFAAMWVLVLNGLVYLAFIYLHGEWRDLVPRRGDVRDSWEMFKFYAFARRDHPRQGKVIGRHALPEGPAGRIELPGDVGLFAGRQHRQVADVREITAYRIEMPVHDCLFRAVSLEQ